MLSSITVGILKAVMEISSNREALLPSLPLRVEVKSLLTDFHEVVESPSGEPDGRIRVMETSSGPTFSFEEDRMTFRGPFLGLEERASDLRFSLWGNQGFLYRYTLSILEKAHRLYSLHACGLFDESRRRLYVITGGGGSGKTVFLLSGLERGLKLFSTETVHFELEGDSLVWHMGSLIDNIRYGTLVQDFPSFRPEIPPPPENMIWQKKIAVDLSSYRSREQRLKNVEVAIIFPRIEAGRSGYLRLPVLDRRKAVQLLFDNISEKIGQSTLLYDCLPLPGLDDEASARARLATLDGLIRHPSLQSVDSVLSNPRDCWGDTLSP